MISFRQHVVTLVAVFLALAVGVVLGGGPLSEVGRDALTSTSAKPKARQGDAASAFGDAFATAAAPRLYDEQLAGRSVALVSLPGADQRVIEGLVGQIEHAGGTVEGKYALQPGLVDPGEKSLVDTLGSQLMTQLGPGRRRRGRADLRAHGPAARHRDRDRGRESGAGASQNPTSIRQSLAGADLVVSPGERTGAVAAGAGRPRQGIDDDILGGLLSGLASRAIGVVVAGDTRSGANGDVAALRARPEAGRVTTVDGVELAVGQVTTALALVRSLSEKGGSFGASGSDGAAPLR